MNPMLILIVSQVIFNSSDLLARYNMSRLGFNLNAFLSLWFMAYLGIRLVASVGQLYVFTQFELGKTMTLVGVVGLITANLFGILLLKEVLSPAAYAGIGLAIISFMLVGYFK